MTIHDPNNPKTCNCGQKGCASFKLNAIPDPFETGQWCQCKHHRKFHTPRHFGTADITCKGYALDGSGNSCRCTQFEEDDY